MYKRQIYQIAESNRIEKIDLVAKIESNRIETFSPNWNALMTTTEEGRAYCWSKEEAP